MNAVYYVILHFAPTLFHQFLPISRRFCPECRSGSGSEDEGADKRMAGRKRECIRVCIVPAVRTRVERACNVSSAIFFVYFGWR